MPFYMKGNVQDVITCWCFWDRAGFNVDTNDAALSGIWDDNTPI